MEEASRRPASNARPGTTYPPDLEKRLERFRKRPQDVDPRISPRS